MSPLKTPGVELHLVITAVVKMAVELQAVLGRKRATPSRRPAASPEKLPIFDGGMKSLTHGFDDFFTILATKILLREVAQE